MKTGTRPLMTVKEVTAMLGFENEKSVYRMVDAGMIPHYRIPVRVPRKKKASRARPPIRFDPDEVRAWLQKRKIEPKDHKWR